MPLITHSRKGDDLYALCRSISRLFDEAVAVRRGTKTVKRLAEVAEREGFAKVVLIENRSKSKSTIVTVLTKEGGRLRWGTTYIIKRKGKSIHITDMGGNDAKNEFKNEAE